MDKIMDKIMDKEMPQMTEAEVMKALECCIAKTGKGCSKCPYHHFYEECRTKRNNDCIDLINRLEAQNNDLFYKLNGVMLSIDKWLEGNELKQDEVNRAITMREKTLRLVEGLENDVEKFKGFYEEAAVLMRGHSNENTLLMKENVELKKKLKTAKSEAYREYEKHVRMILEKRYGKGYMRESKTIGDLVNLTKELTEKNDFNRSEKH